MSKTYKIEFNAKEIISYEEYTRIIDELSNWYQEKIIDIRKMYDNLLDTKDYSNSFNIMHEHKKLIIELLTKLINKFPLQDLEIAIYLSNSFARGGNLINSDIDLNFMYEDLEKGKIFEELIATAISKIVSKYRDFVHDSISHRIPTSNKNITEDDEIIYEIFFQEKTIRNKITKGNERLMYRLYNSNKNINSFFKYYTEKLSDDDLNEWIYFQNYIYSSPDYLDKLFSYINEVENNTVSLKFNAYRQNLISAISSEISNIDNLYVNDIALFKKYFKNKIYKYIYEVLIILKKEQIIRNKNSSFQDARDLLSLLKNSNSKNIINEYFGNIMLFNHICNLYGIEFRTRYSQIITEEFKEFYKEKMKEKIDFIDKFKKLAKELLLSLIKELEQVEIYKTNTTKYDPLTEQINIKDYSPLSHINNISKVYQNNAFLLPFIEKNGKIIPIHPDTLDDLNISHKDVCKYELVYPTSSFRTVYSKEKNICYKLPVLRQITRSIRSLSNKEMKRSELAQKELSKYSYPNFEYLEEKCFYNEEEIFNYLIRYMPDKKIYPWFYCLATNDFSKEFQIKVIENMINIWMFYASKGIYFESAHTQNFLVDDEATIYYRDLSDIRILEYEIMTPSYINELKSKKELLSIFFDRSMCSQNIEHFIKYCKDITEEDIKYIKDIIKREIKKYNLEFPSYSMNYDKNKSGHHPIKTKLVRLREK